MSGKEEPDEDNMRMHKPKPRSVKPSVWSQSTSARPYRTSYIMDPVTKEMIRKDHYKGAREVYRKDPVTNKMHRKTHHKNSRETYRKDKNDKMVMSVIHH